MAVLTGASPIAAQTGAARTSAPMPDFTGVQYEVGRLLSGVVVDQRSELVGGVAVSAQWTKGSRTATTDILGALFDASTCRAGDFEYRR